MLKQLITFYHSQEPIAFWSVGICSLSALAVILLLVINLKSLPTQLPLYYSLPWGERQLATIPEFVVLPASVVVISLVNLVISWHLHASQLVLKRMLSVTSLAIALITLITALKIIYLFL